MGVVAVETRSVEVLIPADPGNPDSEARVCDVIPLFHNKPLIRSCAVAKQNFYSFTYGWSHEKKMSTVWFMYSHN